ncbi:MAG: response regulator [Bacteroidia bacterium]|nr:response regulator [Bacteroidia bacterium]
MTPTPNPPTRVFIVEDEILIAENARVKLTKLGYDVVHVAMTGEEAVVKILELRPDVVLMDIKLGGELDGIETAGQVLESYPVPIIFTTAYSDQATLSRVKSILPYGYIIKPYQLTDLSTNIELALHRFQDFLARQQATAALERAFTVVNDALVVLDGQLRVLYLNPSAEALVGLPLASVQGQPFGDRLQLNETAALGWLQAHHQRAEAVALPAGARLVHPSGGSVQVEGTVVSSGADGGLLISLRGQVASATAQKLTTYVELEERDRLRIAETLHESIGQLLSAAKMNLEALPSSEGGKHIEASKALLNDAVLEVRRMTQQVLPNLLKDFGLGPSLRAYFIDLQKQYPGHALSFSAEGLTQRLPPSEEYTFYRLTQDLVAYLLKDPGCNHINGVLADVEAGVQLQLVFKETPNCHTTAQALLTDPALVELAARTELLGAILDLAPHSPGWLQLKLTRRVG